MVHQPVLKVDRRLTGAAELWLATKRATQQASLTVAEMQRLHKIAGDRNEALNKRVVASHFLLMAYMVVVATPTSCMLMKFFMMQQEGHHCLDHQVTFKSLQGITSQAALLPQNRGRCPLGLWRRNVTEPLD